MDDANLHLNLHNLKQRISDLSSKYPVPNPQISGGSSNMSGDTLSSQIQDLRAHIDSLQSSLIHQSRMQQPSSPSLFSGSTQTQSQITLPSGSVFWHLFNSLRTDFQVLDNRVAAVEQNISDLEDKFDGLDPNRFTPPGSTTVSEAPSLPSNNYSYSTLPADFVGWKMGYSVGSNAQNSSPALNHNMAGLNLAAFSQNQPSPSVLNQQQNSYQPSLQTSPFEIWQSLQPWIEPLSRSEDRLTSDMAEANAAINNLQEENEEWKNRTYYLGQQVRNLDRAVKDLLVGRGGQQLSAKNNVVKPEALKYNSTFPTEGVAFRDQEIARMDEQLQIALERLRLSDEATAEKDKTINFLALQRDEYDARWVEWTGDMRVKVREYLDKIKEGTQENESLRKQIENHHQALESWSNNYSDLNEALKTAEIKTKDVERALLESEKEHATDAQLWRQSYDSTRAQLQQCERVFHRYREDKTREMDRVVADHEKRMKGLQEFCEQKDAVIHKQEKLLSQGRTLVEERDGEIDELQRRLKTATDDKIHALRTQARVEKLLEERDGELARLREAPRVSGVRWSDLHEKRSTESDEPVTARTDRELPARSTMATDGSVADGREQVNSSTPIVDLLTDGSRAVKYAGEVNDLLTEDNDTQPKAESDVDEVPPTRAPMWSPRPARRFKRPQQIEHDPYFRSNSVREPQQQEDKWLSYSDQRRQAQKHRDFRRGGRGEGRHRRQPANSSHSPPHPRDGEAFVLSEQRRLKPPSDDHTLWPPLPAPVTARRMASEADLRTSSPRNDGRAMRSLSKHQSMQDLPNRNKLQAYVTNESAENSGGEFGGAV